MHFCALSDITIMNYIGRQRIEPPCAHNHHEQRGDEYAVARGGNGRQWPSDDQAFMKALLDEYGALGRFSHREHLHMAWSYVQRDGMPKGAEQAVAFIRHVAARHGGADKYHETVTRFWVYAMALAIAAAPRSDDFEQLLANNPHLTDKHLPAQYWTDELLRSREAKAVWVEPDIAPLPEIPVIAPARG